MTRNNLVHWTLFAALLASTACVGQRATSAATPTTSTENVLPSSQAWPVAAPEAQGMNADLSVAIENAIRKNGYRLNSALVLRHGFLIYEAYYNQNDAETKFDLFSVTKSVVSALIGMAIEQGKLSGVDQKVLDFFPGQRFKNTDERKQAMTLDHVLSMTTGLEWSENDINSLYQSADWVQAMLDRPMVAQPGEQFNYCSGCTQILVAILEKGTGQKALDFARENLFQPLGIDDVTWGANPQGQVIGGWGLQLTARDMAKLGALYLHNGDWNGKQVIPRDWVQTSVSAHIQAEPKWDYGYLWWIYPQIKSYAALGRGGQDIFVLPEQDLIVVFTAEGESGDTLGNLIEEAILPAVKE